MDSGAQRAAPRCRGAPHRPPRRRAAAAVDEVKKSVARVRRSAFRGRAQLLLSTKPGSNRKPFALWLRLACAFREQFEIGAWLHTPSDRQGVTTNPSALERFVVLGAAGSRNQPWAYTLEPGVNGAPSALGLAAMYAFQS